MSSITEFLILIGAFILVTTFTEANKNVTKRVCNNETLIMRCLHGQGINVKNTLFGRPNATICHDPGESGSPCPIQHDNYLNNNYLIKQRCQYKKTCSIEHGNLIDPCPSISKYLEIEYTCCRLDRIVKFEIACKRQHQPLTIKCNAKNDEIKIHDVVYGRGPCPPSQLNKKSKILFDEKHTATVLKQCDGQQTCSLTSGTLFNEAGEDAEYLEVVLCSFSAFNLATADECVTDGMKIESGLTQNDCCFGYKLTEEANGTSSCVPICEPPCVNGRCTQPGECECLPQFSNKTADHVCEPICKVECVNSTCVRNDECKCHEGFTKYDTDPFKCKPDCPNCMHGECIAPGICKCFQGYHRDSREKMSACKPICDPPCVNGECTKRGECSCSLGFSNKTSDHVCEPICKGGCVNSTCVKDGECECYNGFIKDQQDPSKCKPSCSTCLQDECVAPNICRCPAGSTKIYVESSKSNDVLNTTALHLAWCIPLHPNNQNETETILAGVFPGYTAIILLLISVLVVGILALTMAHIRKKWTAYKVNSGRVNPDITEDQRDEQVTMELQDASATQSSK